MRQIVFLIGFCLSGCVCASGQPLLYLQQPRSNVQQPRLYVHRDLTYAAGRQLDLYSTAPAGGRATRPVILLIHGGGFWEGDKASGLYVDMARAMAGKGYIVVSINYRLKGKDQPYARGVLDTCMTDVMEAYAWICRNSRIYGIDTTQCFIGGDSAGGGIAVNTCYDHPELFTGCIDLWGGLPGGGGWEASIYSRQLPATTPPTLIMHGTSDRIIPFTTSRTLDARLRAAGVEEVLCPLEGADHYPVQLTGQIIDSMTTFVDRLLHSGTRARALDLVNPFIGTANTGNTNPGAVRPWGMASISPFNTYDTAGGNAGASPYVYGRKKIYGFTQLNMSGLGCGDMGIVCLSPGTGAIRDKSSSSFSREKASPGYYAVSLDEPGIDVELTSTCRTSLASFTFSGTSAFIAVDLGMGLSERKGGMVRLVSDTEVAGYKNIGNICGLQSMQTVYFVVRVSRKPDEAGIRTEGKYFDRFQRETAGNEVAAYFQFRTNPGEKVLVKTGFSYVSIEGARANLEVEQPGFDFENTLLAAQKDWTAQLSRIRVEGGRITDQVQFYTALYHMLIHPGRADDADGSYRCFESNATGKADSAGRYSVFSLWDTYRTLHPFLSLVYPGRQSAMVKSLIGMSKEGGWLPRWEYAGIETGAMTGDPSLPVIADAWLRGIRDFDVAAAYAAMKRNALTPETESYMRPGMEQWQRRGFIPEDAPNVLRPFDPSPEQAAAYPFMKARRTVWGCVSTVLEYCMADWSLAQLAAALGHPDDERFFMKRAMTWRNNFDSSIGFMRPRLQNGQWLTPFDPAERKNNAFTEGTAWNYSFMVPYDLTGLIASMGGQVAFRKRLDECFEEGHFDITNEPDLAYPYLYNHLAGEEWRTADRLQKLRSDHFGNSPAGLPGNDDCGELSSWLLCTMMGLYPDCPGRPDYQVTTPVFDGIVITLDPAYYPGRQIRIELHRGLSGSGRIRSIRWNGKSTGAYNITHDQLVKGGVLSITTR